MANELNLRVHLDYLKSGVAEEIHKTLAVTVTGTEIANFVQSIGITEEAVSVSDMTTQGWVYAENLDTTNYVELGPTSKMAIKLKAGECALFRTTAALYATANTAAVRVRFIIIED